MSERIRDEAACGYITAGDKQVGWLNINYKLLHDVL
jgi:hypothetical protein